MKKIIDVWKSKKIWFYNIRKRAGATCLFIILLSAVLLLGPLESFAYQESGQVDNTDFDLDSILQKCADYCEKLIHASFDFTCYEEIDEEKAQTNPTVLRISRALRRHSRIQTENFQKSSFLYDYQLIYKNKKFQEKRILLNENGEERNKKDAVLQTKFKHRYAIFGPVGLLSSSSQRLHDYKIIGKEKGEEGEIFVLEVVPMDTAKVEHLYGKVWIKLPDVHITKIEWIQESLRNYDVIEKFAQKCHGTPRITLISEYGHEKNGLRFPSKYSIEEAYIIPGRRKKIASKKTVRYTNYEFFSVEVDVRY
ncbi:MAG: hypothetical protein JXB26_13475 [Candidatus Aminicenantes bacterium]|nr:hypothetical protein [Candidatus Aminicenantes bacterium]